MLWLCYCLSTLKHLILAVPGQGSCNLSLDQIDTAFPPYSLPSSSLSVVTFVESHVLLDSFGTCVSSMTSSSARVGLATAERTNVILTAKPHAFGGAVLSPKHARELTPGLCLAIASALSSDFSRNAIIPYTVWITEAWRVLGWAEPSAALFWEMATMYHTLYLAGRVESDDQIPPILSCGSHSSMGSAAPEQKQQRQKYSTTAKELPVWLIGTFLLVHCEESTYRINSKSDGDPPSANLPSWQQQKLLSARYVMHVCGTCQH